MRLRAIGQEVSKGEYDLYLFQELWIEEDYNTIKASIPAEYQITNFLDFSVQSPKCELQYCLPLCKFSILYQVFKYFTINNGMIPNKINHKVQYDS